MTNKPRPIGGKDEDFCICGHHELNHANYQGWPRVCNQTGCKCVSYVRGLAAPVEGVVLPERPKRSKTLIHWISADEAESHFSLLEKLLAEAIAQRDEARKELDFCGDIMGKICVYGTLVHGEKPIDPPPHAAIAAILAQIARAERAEAELATARAEGREEGLRESDEKINMPETEDFFKGVPLEAAHQRARWGTDHDSGKAPADWFWLVGYLAGKCLAAHIAGNQEKALHHTISTAAALANWHMAIKGFGTMRPGIEEPK
jgi:hypothetical protein